MLFDVCGFICFLVNPVKRHTWGGGWEMVSYPTFVTKVPGEPGLLF